MASTASAKPACPVCHQADQVKTTQAAYNSGVARCAPPDMPTKQVSMFPYIAACMVLIGICVFLIIVFVGGLESNVPPVALFALVVVTLIIVISVLAVSYYAFQRVVSGDNENSALYPVWDKATETWKGLDYCSRDDVVFDPRINQVVPDKQLAALRDFRAQPGTLSAAVSSH